MNCLQARELFSPHMDDMLEASERESLMRHLEECRVCGKEFKAWERVSQSLRALVDDCPYEVPTSLCTNVISELKLTKKIRMPAVSWRKAVATAAAVLVLASGPALVNTGMKLFNGRPAVVTENPKDSQVTPDNTGGEEITNNTNSGGPGPENRDRITPDSGGQSQPEPNTAPAGKTAITPESTAAKVSKANVYSVLLNTKMEITSTLLKVKTSSQDPVFTALTTAKAAGATTQLLDNQIMDGRKVSIIRMVVPENNAQGLIGQLSGMGHVINKENETRDITARYNETLLQYEELVEKGDPGAQSLEKQLESWKKEIGSHIVVLWLEQG